MKWALGVVLLALVIVDASRHLRRMSSPLSLSPAQPVIAELEYDEESDSDGHSDVSIPQPGKMMTPRFVDTEVSAPFTTDIVLPKDTMKYEDFNAKILAGGSMNAGLATQNDQNVPNLGTQGVLGDCWLVSTIISLCRKTPSLITTYVRPTRTVGQYEVSVYDITLATVAKAVKVAKPGGPRLALVSADLPVTKNSVHPEAAVGKLALLGLNCNTKWCVLAGLVEKAVAGIQGGKNYKNIKSDSPSMGYTLLTGKSAKVHAMTGSGITGAATAMAALRIKFDAGTTFVSASAKRTCTKPDGTLGPAEDHAMVVTAISIYGDLTVYDQSLQYDGKHGHDFYVELSALRGDDIKPSTTVDIPGKPIVNAKGTEFKRCDYLWISFTSVDTA